MANGKIAFKCLDCGMINVFPQWQPDGHNCMSCGGILTPIGSAMVSVDKKNAITIQVKAEGLDEIECQLRRIRTSIEEVEDKSKRIASMMR